MSEHKALEEQISHWRDYLRRQPAIRASDVEELEDHLRGQLDMLINSGLEPDEAFLVAVKRMGSLNALSREFAREHSERLWKQLVAASSADGESNGSRFDMLVVLLLAAAAAVAIKLPALFGLRIADGGHDALFYVRNASLFVFPLLTGYFAWKRGLNAATYVSLAVVFVVAALFANVYPFAANSDTQGLTALHLPIALWLAVGVAYVGGRWFADRGRMDFVRFSGELFIYYVLIALGGFVITAFTLMTFRAIGINAEWLAKEWLVPCGAASAVIVGSWLVEAKKSVIENMAPVLTRLFTPLLAAVLLVFLVTMVWTGNPVDVQRGVLISFDLLLALVVGLVLYSTSARDPQAAPDFFDWLQLVLIVAALAVDAVALTAVASRISEYGFTPNRVAALGENLILLANLAGSAWFYARFLRGHGSFASLERWQINYLPVLSVWAGFVVIVFPPVFSYR